MRSMEGKRYLFALSMPCKRLSPPCSNTDGTSTCCICELPHCIVSKTNQGKPASNLFHSPSENVRDTGLRQNVVTRELKGRGKGEGKVFWGKVGQWDSPFVRQSVLNNFTKAGFKPGTNVINLDELSVNRNASGSFRKIGTHPGYPGTRVPLQPGYQPQID
eukprot:205930-Rhodomonas_salina.1